MRATCARAAAPYRFVDQEVLAVKPANRADPAVGEVGEQAFVERAGLGRAMAWSQRPADDVVLDIVGQRGEHALDIVARLVAEMLIEPGVHHFAGKHGESIFPIKIDVA